MDDKPLIRYQAWLDQIIMGLVDDPSANKSMNQASRRMKMCLERWTDGAEHAEVVATVLDSDVERM